MSYTTKMKELYEAFGRGEVPVVLGAMHPEIQWREAEGNPYSPEGKPFTGPDEVLNKLFMRLVEEWDEYTVSPETFYGAGDTVVVEGRYTGIYKETGKSVDAPFCHIWHLTDDHVTAFQQYTNTAAFQNVMEAVSVV